MKKNQTMKEMPYSERPYEKFQEYGPQYLTDGELLTIILQSGTRGVSSLQLANEILALCPGKEGLAGLYHVSLEELKSLPGIGQVKAMQLKCIGEISKRIARKSARERLQVRRAESVADYYMESLRHEEQEHVCCMMLDSQNKMLADICLTKGTVNASLISPREVFLKALEYHAVNVILVHNHPSGDPTPSRADLEVTSRIVQSGELLGIGLLDHIIIGNKEFYSIMEHHSFESDKED